MSGRLSQCLDVLLKHFDEDVIRVSDSSVVVIVGENAHVCVSLTEGFLHTFALNAHDAYVQVLNLLASDGISLDNTGYNVCQMDLG